MNRPHFRRHPRPVDPEPEYSRLDRLDGLRTRYDIQWPDVLAAEGGLALGRALDLADLPADQSGFTALADWPVWDYGEGYAIEPEERAVVDADQMWVRLAADASRFIEAMARLQAEIRETAEPAKPRGRHRQTDPHDLILADLRDIEDRLS